MSWLQRASSHTVLAPDFVLPCHLGNPREWFAIDLGHAHTHTFSEDKCFPDHRCQSLGDICGIAHIGGAKISPF